MPIVTINRVVPFDPVTFIGSGWRIVGEDEKSLSLSEVNLGTRRMLKRGELWSSSKVIRQRLKRSKEIPLDAKVFQTLWENQHLIPEDWKRKTPNPWLPGLISPRVPLWDAKSAIDYHLSFREKRIFFDGTAFRRRRGPRYVLYLIWSQSSNEWKWNTCDIWDIRGYGDLTAILV